jgi:hypothetical protein
MTGLALVAMNPGGDEDVYEEKAFGFWIYLMSDAIIFALLFATYVVMVPNSASGPTGKTLFSLPRTFAETMLLLTSSSTLALHPGDEVRRPAKGAGGARDHRRARRGVHRPGAQRVRRHDRPKGQSAAQRVSLGLLHGTRGGGGQRGSRGLWSSEARIR